MRPHADRPEPDAPVQVRRKSASFQPSVAHASSQTNDERLQIELEQLLHDQLFAPHQLEITVLGDIVILRGRVSLPIDRLLAEDLVYTIPRVYDCHNRLTVSPDEEILEYALAG